MKRVKITLKEASDYIYNKYSKKGITRKDSRDEALDILGDLNLYYGDSYTRKDFRNTADSTIEDLFTGMEMGMGG